MNDKLLSRLLNYKFESALNYLEGEFSNVKELVNSLAQIFGNSGLIDGHLRIVIDNALENIGVKFI